MFELFVRKVRNHRDRTLCLYERVCLRSVVFFSFDITEFTISNSREFCLKMLSNLRKDIVIIRVIDLFISIQKARVYIFCAATIFIIPSSLLVRLRHVSSLYRRKKTPFATLSMALYNTDM